MGSIICTLILVIFIAVNNGHHVMGSATQTSPARGSRIAKIFQIGNDNSNPVNVTHRGSRQMNFITTTLRTMGCVPKFFCGMNSKSPSPGSSTLNDLAYLIKFAMTDLDDEDLEMRKESQRNVDDSGEDIDPELRTHSEENKENERIEQLAEDLLVKDDPGILKFMRVTSKQKYNGKMDDILSKDAMAYAIAEREKYEKEENENNSKPKSKITTLLTGVKNMFRLGKSWKHSKYAAEKQSKKKTAFWEGKEFRQQMLLAAKVAESERYGKDSLEEPDVCSSTFDLCPYSYNQMKRMIRGEPEPTKKSEHELKLTTPTASSIVLNGVTYPVSLLSPGSQKPLTQVQPQTQPQPIIYMIHPESMMELNFNSNSTPAPTRKTYSIKLKPNTPAPALAPSSEMDDDEYTPNWTDSYFQDKSNKTPNESIPNVQVPKLEIRKTNNSRPYEDNKEENYHKFSYIKPTTKRPQKPFRPSTQPPESENDSGSGSDESNEKTSSTFKQPDKKPYKRPRPQESEASQSQEDQGNPNKDHQETSASDEDDDENEGNGGKYPVFNMTINRPPKTQSKYSQEHPPLWNNDAKDTSASDEDENVRPQHFPQNDGGTTSEENDSEEEKIVWAQKTTPMWTTSSATTTTTTPKPGRRTTPKYKPRPKGHVIQDMKNEEDSGDSPESSEEEHVKHKEKKKPQKRRPLTNSAHPDYKGHTSHETRTHPKGHQRFSNSAKTSKPAKLRKKFTKPPPPSTTTTTTPVPPKDLDEENPNSEETTEESSEEEDSVPPTVPSTTPPPPRLTTTRKPRPTKRPMTPRSTPSTTTLPPSEPEYGSLPQIPDIPVEDSNFPALNGLPVPSALIPTPAPSPLTTKQWNNFYTAPVPLPQKPLEKVTIPPKTWENKNNFPYPIFLSLTSPTSSLPSPTVATMNLFAAISQANRDKKVFGKEKTSPFGLHLNNILNSSNTAQVLQGVGVDPDMSTSSWSEEEPNLTSQFKIVPHSGGQGHMRPQFWDNYKTQQQQSYKRTQNFTPSSTRSGLNYQSQMNYHLPEDEKFDRPQFSVPHRPLRMPHPSNPPQRQRYQNVQEPMFPILQPQPNQYSQPQFRNPYPQRQPQQQQDLRNSYQPQFPNTQQEWSSYPLEGWPSSPVQQPFVGSHPKVPVNANFPRYSYRRPSSSTSREQGRIPPNWSTMKEFQQSSQNDRSSISSRERIRMRQKTRFSTYQQRHGEESTASTEDDLRDDLPDDTEPVENNDSPSGQQETDHEIKEVLLDAQQKLQLEFAERLHDLAKQQLILAQQQVFQKPSSKEKDP